MVASLRLGRRVEITPDPAAAVGATARAPPAVDAQARASTPPGTA